MIAIDTPEEQTTTIWLGRCLSCKTPVAIETDTPNRPEAIKCEDCERLVSLQKVRGKVTTKKCDANCTRGTRPVCHCSCGGRNHGSAHRKS
jgi:hypothetical protein